MIGGLIRGIAGPIVNGVTKVFTSREERRTAEASAKGALAVARQEGHNEVSLKRAEWEALMARASDNSWKDEFWTFILAMPFAMMFVGSIMVVFFDDSRLLDANALTLKQLDDLGLNYGYILGAVILAAFGIRWARR